MDDRYTVPGSERRPLPNAQVVGEVNPSEQFLVTVVVRPRAQPNTVPAGIMSRQEYANAYGANPDDLAAVEQFASDNGLEVVESSVPRRSVVLRGTAAQFSAAFGVSLKMYRAGDATYRGREGSITIPSQLQGIVQAVLGLDNRPQARTHFRRREKREAAVRPAAQAAVSFSPVQVAQLYNFPTNVDGSGECIGIIELGGGFAQSDLDAYFKNLGITGPTVTAVAVDGANNAPGQDTNADTEVMLDIEVAGAVARGASIVVYFGPNTDQGFLDAITTAVNDATNKPSVISISWGGPESSWTQQAMDSYTSAFQSAAAMGVSVCCASGDGGSSDGVNDGSPHADFPASSSYALGCGGTTLQGSGGAIQSETVWSDSGGGVSAVFALPPWQTNAGVPSASSGGRGVPDVSGDADPNTGYDVRVDGQDVVVGGTSAVAPLWAGLIALMNQNLGKPVGFLNPALYGLKTNGNSAPLHDITSGSNGAYNAGTGWDPCTGLGSPNGAVLLQALSAPSQAAT